eukprot:superscaffoldBa00001738_g11808
MGSLAAFLLWPRRCIQGSRGAGRGQPKLRQSGQARPAKPGERQGRLELRSKGTQPPPSTSGQSPAGPEPNRARNQSCSPVSPLVKQPPAKHSQTQRAADSTRIARMGSLLHAHGEMGRGGERERGREEELWLISNVLNLILSKFIAIHFTVILSALHQCSIDHGGPPRERPASREMAWYTCLLAMLDSPTLTGEKAEHYGLDAF